MSSNAFNRLSPEGLAENALFSEGNLIKAGVGMQVMGGLLGAVEAGLNSVRQDQMREYMANVTRARQAQISRQASREAYERINAGQAATVSQIENDAAAAINLAEAELQTRLEDSRAQAKQAEVAGLVGAVGSVIQGAATLAYAQKTGAFAPDKGTALTEKPLTPKKSDFNLRPKNYSDFRYQVKS